MWRLVSRAKKGDLSKGVETSSRNPGHQGLETVAFFFECVFEDLPSRLAIEWEPYFSFACRTNIPALD